MRSLKRSAGLALIFSIVMGEIALRLAGVSPLDVEFLQAIAATIEIKPGGQLIEPAPDFGYRLKPGTFAVTFANKTWHVTQTAEHTRNTVNVGGRPNDRLEIWVFGCSFACGFGVDDAETFSSQLQSRLPDRRIINHAAYGYSDVQSLLRFRQELKHRPAPSVAILAYAPFHDMRNTYSRGWQAFTQRTYLRLGMRAHPYGYLENGTLRIGERLIDYRPIPLESYSSILTLIDLSLMKYDERSHRSTDVTHATFQAFETALKTMSAGGGTASIRGRGSRKGPGSGWEMFVDGYFGRRLLR